MNVPYRILIILTQAFNPNDGGVQMSTFKMGRHFAELGHEIAVFSFKKRGHVQCEFGHLHVSPEVRGKRNSANLGALEHVLDEFQPDVVINQMPYEHEIGKILRDNKRFLLLGCLRNTLFSVKGDLSGYVRRTAPPGLRILAECGMVQKMFLALHRRRHRADLLRILDTYDHFVMFGPPNLDELRYFVPGFHEDKVRLVPNSIPVVAETPPAKEKRLLWLGRVADHQKRAELILPIWKRVSEALPDWELDVVGDGPLLEALRRECRASGLPRIMFHGRQIPDVYYRRASIFFMTSAFEGFPNTLVEAQSHAVIPVVFDSYPVASWIVKNGEGGYLVKPFDVDAMAKRIIELANSPDRHRVAEQALESARRFQVDHVGRIWQEIFDAEVPKHSKPAARETLA